MNSKEVNDILKKIIHPKLHKDIVTLELIQSIQIQSNSLEITLSCLENDVYSTIANAISKTFKPYFSEIRIMKQSSKNELPSINKSNLVKNVLGIVSSKGGVGKSTIALNIAINFAKKGLHVGILDGDTQNSSNSWLLHVNNEDLLLSHPNLKIINIQKILNGSDLCLNGLDLLVIDFSTNFPNSDKHLFSRFRSMDLIFVTTPHKLSHNGAKTTIQKFHESGINVMGFIENMSNFIAPDSKAIYPIFGKSEIKTICEQCNLPLLAKIPIHSIEESLKVEKGNSPFEPLVHKLLTNWINSGNAIPSAGQMPYQLQERP